MDAGLALGCLSAMCAFVAAGALSWALVSEVDADSRRAAAAHMGFGSSWADVAMRRVRNGFSFCKPFARFLLGHSRLSGIAGECTWLLVERGLATTPEALLSLCLVAVGLLVAIVGVATGSLLTATMVAACVIGLALAAAKTAWERRAAAMREEVPDALAAMKVCFQAGLSLMQTLNQVAHETKGPLKVLFQRAFHILETGGTITAALGVFHVGSSIPELAFVATALDVQHQTGGSMTQVLAAARDTVESELALERSLRVQTAQAKLSARIVTILPFLLIALFSLMSPDFLKPFFSSVTGVALLAFALVMQLAGVLLVRRMLKVEVS